MTQATSTAQPRGHATRWTRLATGSMLAVSAVLASVSAMNASAAPGHAPRAAFHKVAHHPGPGGAPGILLGGPGLDRLLDEVQATAPQRAQIRQIAGAARDDLRKLREDAPDLRKDTLNVLTQPSIDVGAAEQARQKMLAQHDAVSKRTLTAMLDVAKVLTPEQRAQLGEKFKARQAEREKRREAHRHDRTESADRLPGDGAPPPPAQ